MFHTHNFQEVERFYAKPNEKINIPYIDVFTAKVIFGQTTIIYKCVDTKKLSERVCVGCGETYKEEILGKNI